MLLGGFSLELLVDGKLLKEYSEPVYKRTTTTGASYVLDQKTGEKIESDKTFYAAVEQEDKSYEILFGVKKGLFTVDQQSDTISFRTKIYVDGQLDRSLRLINKSAKMKKDGFIGEKRKLAPLMFELSKWKENDEGNIKNNNDDNSNDEKKLVQDKFGYGAISIYFFNAKDIDKNETNGDLPVPLAALHLHYRPTQWLLARDIFVEKESMEIFDETQVTKDIKNKNEQATILETTTFEIEEIADNDCDISEWTGKLILDDEREAIEENQGAKRKLHDKKEKKAKNEVEEHVNDHDCDISEQTRKLTLDDTQETIEEAQGKKKFQGRKEKKNVEKSKDGVEEPVEDDRDISERTRKLTLDDTQEAVEENKGTKRKPRGKREKKNVEKAKDEIEVPIDGDFDISEQKGKLIPDDTQEAVEENKGTKRKPIGKREKKNVAKVEVEETVDCNLSERTEKLTLNDTQEVAEENQGKRKPRGKSEKKNAEKVKDEVEESVDKNQGAKRKPRGKKEKKNVEETKDGVEESGIKRYNLRARK
ncbi:hypothetical protein C1645_833993 [Glomus cerebriforme]|uniref:Uncharacterized protein n=1 Tax=Glomus cerebriforme TaxID=658196 RepID=A0A397SF49_9GLOM|nr:hypothetical protein C1645_833993 [Glomus cerebriforme]